MSPEGYLAGVRELTTSMALFIADDSNRIWAYRLFVVNAKTCSDIICKALGSGVMR